MYNKKIYDAVFDCSIDDKSLKDFIINIKEAKLDKHNSFDKYYSLDIINLALKKVQDEERDALWLANWANCYNHIIMASALEGEYSDNQAKDFVMELISDTLDVLSFYDSDDEEYGYSIKNYIHNFAKLDTLYKMIDEVNTFYSLEKNLESFEMNIIFVNEKQKIFYSAKSFDLTDIQNDDATLLLADELDEKIKQLKLEKYKQIELD